jgi:ABC-type sugar transport system permease subunit
MSTFMLGLLLNLPFVMALIATALVWRIIHHRALFLVTAALSLLGLQSIIAPASIGIFLPHGGGLSQAVVIDSFTQSVRVAAVVILLLGVPYLWWLRYAFRKP